MFYLTSLLFVKCAGLVIVRTLGAADAGDDGGEEEQGGDYHRHPDHRDHTEPGPRLRDLVTGLSAAIAVQGGAAAVEASLPRPARAEEAAVPHTEDVRVAGAVLRPYQS